MIKHIGNDNESMYFQLLLNNETGEKFYLTVKDQDGIVLFQDVYNDKNLTKIPAYQRRNWKGDLFAEKCRR